MPFFSCFCQENEKFDVILCLQDPLGRPITNGAQIKIKSVAETFEVGTDGCTDKISLSKKYFLNRRIGIDVYDKSGNFMDARVREITEDQIYITIELTTQVLLDELRNKDNLIEELTKKYNSDIDEVIANHQEKVSILRRDIIIKENEIQRLDVRAEALRKQLSDSTSTLSDMRRDLSKIVSEKEKLSIDKEILLARKKIYDDRIKELENTRTTLYRSNTEKKMVIDSIKLYSDIKIAELENKLEIVSDFNTISKLSLNNIQRRNSFSIQDLDDRDFISLAFDLAFADANGMAFSHNLSTYHALYKINKSNLNALHTEFVSSQLGKDQQNINFMIKTKKLKEIRRRDFKRGKILYTIKNTNTNNIIFIGEFGYKKGRLLLTQVD